MFRALRHEPGIAGPFFDRKVPSMLAPLRTTRGKRSIFRVFLLLILASIVPVLCSCGKAGRKPVYPVHGQVFDANNRPATGALVIFHPVQMSDPRPLKPLAYVDEKGSFALTTYENGDGAPEGEYVVTIEWRPKTTNPFAANKEGEDRLHGRYRDPKTSKLRFKIEKQADNVLTPIRVR